MAVYTVASLLFGLTAQAVFIVPLHKQDVPVVRNGRTILHKTAYFGDIFVGSPTARKFTVVFDTGSGHFFLPSVECPGEACLLHERYDRSLSSSAVDINWNGESPPGLSQKSFKNRDRVAIDYGTGSVTGSFVNEKLCIGEASNHSENCLNMRLITAEEMTPDPFRQFEFDGVLGLGLAALAVHPGFHFLTQLQGSDNSAAGVFGVSLAYGEGDPHFKNEQSEISFGGVNPERIVGKQLEWTPVVNPEMGYWLLSILRVWAGEDELDVCADGTCTAIADTGTSIMGVPKIALKQMQESLSRPLPAGSPADMDCRWVPGKPLTFELAGGVLLRLDASDITRRASAVTEKTDIAEQTEKCIASLLPVSMPPLGPKPFIFGEPLFLKYYAAFDATQQRVGFAQPSHTQRDSATVV